VKRNEHRCELNGMDERTIDDDTNYNMREKIDFSSTSLR